LVQARVRLRECGGCDDCAERRRDEEFLKHGIISFLVAFL
jgi:hypothetical protein